jgi:hypothetical protein
MQHVVLLRRTDSPSPEFWLVDSQASACALVADELAADTSVVSAVIRQVELTPAPMPDSRLAGFTPEAYAAWLGRQAQPTKLSWEDTAAQALIANEWF